MTTLSQADGYVVLINTFAVDPSKVDALLECLARATEDVMQHLPGFISANFHISLDRTKVLNYAQWRSKLDFDAMLQDERAKPHMRECGELAERFEPVLYELKHTPEGAG